MDETAPKRQPRDIRRALRLPLIRVAAEVRSSEATARIYEADRAAVSKAKRDDFDRYYARLERELEKQLADIGQPEGGGAAA